MFEAEALGLSAMYETQTIRVPKPFKVIDVATFYLLLFTHSMIIKLHSIL